MAKRRASLSPDAQLDLSLRKRLAVSILLASCADRHAQQEEQPIEGQLALAFVARIRAAIAEQLAQERESRDRSLGDFVRAIADELSRNHGTRDNDLGSNLLLERFLSGAKHFDCIACGSRKSAVCDGWNDDQIFRDPRGGRCLNFLRELVETLASVTVFEYARLAKGSFKKSRLPNIHIETRPWQGDHQSTMPIDGIWIPPPEEGDGCATLRVIWPFHRDLSEALKSLPYLLFHELFVHWPQGSSSADRPFTVATDCSFTEGAVDAVASEVFVRAMRDPGLLPSNLRYLRGAFEKAAQEYHEKRMAWQPSGNPGMQDDPVEDIAEARFRGREGVYNFLKKLFRRNNLEDSENHAMRAIVLLNTQLGKDDREPLYLLLREIRIRDPHGDRDFRVLTAFQVYLKQHDWKQLVKELSAAL